jgi:glutathione reductase (NADPH)
MPARRFDLVVIGTGTAGGTVATRCRQAGWTVAIIDSRPFGGTCALRGCDPKKVLVGAAETVDRARRLEGNGIARDGCRIEWPALIRFKRALVDGIPKHREEAYARAGVETFHGRAQFVGPTTVRVSDAVVEGRYVVIGAGAKPVDLPIPGHEHLVTSEQFLELDALPERLVFVGGGYISMELAHISVRAGTQVTVLQRGAQPLPLFDPDLVNQLTERTRELGVDLRVATEVARIEKAGNSFVVHATNAGRELRFDADLVVHGAGRVPDIDDLDLGAGGIEWDPRRGVVVNEFLQSVSNPAVYAAGDAAATDAPRLTPVSGHDGRVVAANLLEGNHARPDYSVVPSVAFTVPPLASVGLQERAARDRGLPFRTHHKKTGGWYSSRRINEPCSGFKVLVEEPGGRILGAHLLGHHADEIVNLFALAMRSGTTIAGLRDMMFAYPTHGSDLPYML